MSASWLLFLMTKHYKIPTHCIGVVQNRYHYIHLSCVHMRNISISYSYWTMKPVYVSYSSQLYLICPKKEVRSKRVIELCRITNIYWFHWSITALTYDVIISHGILTFTVAGVDIWTVLGQRHGWIPAR